MDRVSSSIGICIFVALLVIIVGGIPQETLNRLDAFEVTSGPDSEAELTGTRDVTEVAVTNIAYEGGIGGWELNEAGRVGNFSIGLVGKTTKFTVTVSNNMRNAINNVEVYFEIWTSNVTPNLQIWEVYNTTMTIANIAGGGAANLVFPYRFLFSHLYNITASVNVTGDSDRSNDRLSTNGWANKWADNCEQGDGLWTTMARMGGPNSWHRVDNPLNPTGDHTQDWAWYMGGDNGQYENNIDVELISPEFDLSRMYTSYYDLTFQPTYAFKMVGTRANDEDRFYIDDLTYDNFVNVRNVFNNPGEIGGFNTWSFMRWYSDLNGNQREDPDEPKGLGVPMNGFWGSQWRTIRFRFRFTSDAAGVASGYYVDDIILFGLETYVEDTTPLPKIENVVTWDRQFDGGGNLFVRWDKCTKWDFERYDLYADTSPITNVAGMTPIISNITDGGNTTHLINEIDGTPLVDETKYYFAVTVTDIWGNVNQEVTNGSGTCMDNPPVGVTGLTGNDVPGDEGFNVKVEWDPNTSPDFSYFNVYKTDEQIVSIEELEPVATEVHTTNMTFSNLTNDQGYFFAVTSVDESSPGIENVTVTPHNIIGPVIPIDNLPPQKVTNIITYDTPHDDGSSIQVSWDMCVAPDFDHYRVYVDNEKIRNISALPVEIDDLTTNHTVVKTMNSNKLLDETDYYIAVVAVDVSGNYQKEVTSSSPVASLENIPPVPITVRNASDTPDDEGGSITIKWWSSSDSDFDHYNIYIANSSFDRVDEMEVQTTVENISIQASEIYRMGTKPLVDLYEQYWVAVTAVDRLGNENYSVSSFGPVVCRENVAPDPIYIIDAYDTPHDNGNSITVEIEKSLEEDVVAYEIYVRRTSFSDIRGRTPESVIDATEWNGSVIITEISTMNGAPLENERDHYIAVSAIDLSGNQDENEVIPYGPVRCWENVAPEKVKGLVVVDKPGDAGGVLVAQWNESMEADFAYYEIFVFDRKVGEIKPMHIPFKVYPELVDGSHLVLRSETSAEVDMYQGKLLNEVTGYYLAVVVYDLLGNYNKEVECYGPVKAEKNIFPSLEIPGKYPPDMTIMLNEKLALAINVTNPLDDDYSVNWYLNGLMDRSQHSDRYRKTITRPGLFNITVNLVNDDEDIHDSYTWNITVREPEKEVPPTFMEKNATSLIFGVIGLILIIILALGLIVFRKKKRKDKEEEMAVPRHIITDGEEDTLGRIKEGESPAPPMEETATVQITTESLAPEDSAGGAGTISPGLESGAGEGILALPPHEKGGDEPEASGEKEQELDSLFAPLEDDGKKAATAASGKKKVARRVKRKVVKRKPKALMKASGAEEELLQLPPGDTSKTDEAVPEAADSESDEKVEEVPLAAQLEEETPELVAETVLEPESPVSEQTEPVTETIEETVPAEQVTETIEETVPAEQVTEAIEETIPAEQVTEAIEETVPAEQVTETIEETVPTEQTVESQEQPVIEEQAVEAVPDVTVQLQAIAQQYEVITAEATALREKLSGIEDEQEKQAMIAQYAALEGQVAALQAKANQLQAPPSPEPVTVQCYNCQTLLTIVDTTRPLMIACPNCSAESLLES